MKDRRRLHLVLDHFRILGSSLLCRFFELFLNTVVLEDLNLSEKLGFNQVWAAFRQYEDEFPEELTKHIFCSHLNAEGFVDTSKISRFFAQELLKARPHWDVEDFMDAWDRSLVDVIKPEMSHIADLNLKERHPGSGRMEMTKYFRSDLPSDPESRFIALFKTRARWQYEDLIPFIADFGRDPKELDAVILKHGRFSTQKDVRFITPRSQLLE